MRDFLELETWLEHATPDCNVYHIFLIFQQHLAEIQTLLDFRTFMSVFPFQQRNGCFKVTNHLKSSISLKQVAPPPDVFGKVALAKTFLIPAYKSVSQFVWISSKYHHTMTNIFFRIFAQIRAKFRLFLLSWSVFYFQFTRSNLGEQVSLNKNFCSALGCIFSLLFDNFFIFWLTFSLQLADFFSAADKTFQTFFFFVGKLSEEIFKQNSKSLFFVSCV